MTNYSSLGVGSIAYVPEISRDRWTTQWSGLLACIRSPRPFTASVRALFACLWSPHHAFPL